MIDDRFPAPGCGLVRADEPVVVPWFRIADVAAAVAAVRAAGGIPGDPTPSRAGLLAECLDDQNAPFGLIQH